MRKKHSNISRRERASLPAKPEFAFFGVTAGLISGLLTGFTWEVAANRPARFVMLATGFAGIGIGTGLEALRYWIRLRRFRAAREAAS